jgi:hypothetical protein
MELLCPLDIPAEMTIHFDLYVILPAHNARQDYRITGQGRYCRDYA